MPYYNPPNKTLKTKKQEKNHLMSVFLQMKLCSNGKLKLNKKLFIKN